MTETAMNRYRYLRGLLALWVVLGHCYMYLDQQIWLLEQIHELNLLCVGVFFFQSGYGLNAALHKREDYLKGFLLKKPLRLLLIALVSSIVNAVIIHLLGRGYDDALELITCVLEFINWYVWVQLVFYFLFFIMAKVIRKERLRLLVLTLIVLLMMELLRHTDLGFAYYTAGLAFPAGMFIFIYRDKVETLLQKKKIPFLFGVIVVCVLCYIAKSIQLHRHPVNVYGKNVMCAASSILGMILLTWIPLKGKFLEYLSEISLEIYLYQFVAINAVSKFLWNHGIQKGWNFVFITLIVTVILSVVFSSLRHFVERPRRKE